MSYSRPVSIYISAGDHGCLLEMKAHICPSGKLLCLRKYKTTETVHQRQ